MPAFPKYPAIALTLAAFALTAGAALVQPKQSDHPEPPKAAHPGSTAAAQAETDPAQAPAAQVAERTGPAVSAPTTAKAVESPKADSAATASQSPRTEAAPAGPNNCEEVKAGIDAKIKAKGVKNFTLEDVPAEPAPELAKGAKVVGNCGGGTRLIVYTRR